MLLFCGKWDIYSSMEILCRRIAYKFIFNVFQFSYAINYYTIYFSFLSLRSVLFINNVYRSHVKIIDYMQAKNDNMTKLLAFANLKSVAIRLRLCQAQCITCRKFMNKLVFLWESKENFLKNLFLFGSNNSG